MTFPNCSNLKIIMLGHDAVEEFKIKWASPYNMIISIETLEKVKAVLDFNISIIEIDSITLPKKSLTAKHDP